MAQAAPGAYYVPHGTHWPILGSIGLSSTVTGAALWINETTHYGKYLMAFGIVCLLSMMFGWFRQVIGESLAGIYTRQVDTSFRMGMMVHLSEVMFFARSSARCSTRNLYGAVGRRRRRWRADEFLPVERLRRRG